MKTQKTNVINAIRNKVIPVALAWILLVAPFTEMAAQVTTVMPVEVKYLGSVYNQPVFQVEFINGAEEDLYITLKDEEGEVVYAERFRDKKFSRKFQFSEPELNTITLTVSSKKEKRAHVFQVSKNSRVVEDVVITKIH